MLGGALNFYSQIIIAGSLIKNDFGAITFTIGVATVFASLGGFGAGQYWLKVFGRNGYQALRLIPTTLRYVGIASLISTMLYAIFLTLTIESPSLLVAAAFLCVLIPAQGMLDLASAKLQLEGRLASLAILQLLPHLLRFSAIFVVIKIFEVASLINIAVAIAVSSIILLLICVAQIWQMFEPRFQLEGHSDQQEKIDPPSCRSMLTIELLSKLWPFGAINFLHLLNSLISTVLTFYLLGSSEVALFSVAMIFVMAAYTLPSVLFTKVLAASMHRRIHLEKTALLEHYKTLSIYMVAAGVAISVILYTAGPYIVTFFFGESYSESQNLLTVLSISVPFYFLSVSLDVLLLSGGFIFLKMKIMLALVGLMTVLICIGSIFYGLLGVAVAFVVTQATACLFYCFAYKKAFF